MKKILLTALLLIAVSTCMYAQTGPVGPTKIDFVNKINQLAMYMSQNNVPAANTTWTEVQDMITAEFDYVKYQLNDAIINNNTTAQANLTTLTDQQWTIYEPMLPWRDDLIANQGPLMMKLNDFANTIL